MNEPQVLKIPDGKELDSATIEAASGGSCTPNEIVGITQSLIEVYDNLVDFTSHVIGRVAGE